MIHGMSDSADREWFTPAEAAQLLPDINVDALRRLIRLGRVSARKSRINGRYKIHRSEIERLRDAVDDSAPSAGSADGAGPGVGQPMLSWPGAPTPPLPGSASSPSLTADGGGRR